jgi:hypothetical protein
LVSLNLPEVSFARDLVSGHVRHGVGHSFPQSSDRDYTRATTETSKAQA